MPSLEQIGYGTPTLRKEETQELISVLDEISNIPDEDPDDGDCEDCDHCSGCDQCGDIWGDDGPWDISPA